MTKTVTVKRRTRAGSWKQFMDRYDPISGPDNNYQIPNDKLPKDVDDRQIWTLLDCDGKLYVVPGYHMVNYLARLVTRHAWSDTEFNNPGYTF